MLFLGNESERVKNKGIAIPKNIMSGDTSPRFLENKIHYFPTAGIDGNDSNCLYIDFTDAEGFLKFIERTKKRRESFKDDRFSCQLQERFRDFDSFLRETMENSRDVIIPNLMCVPKAIGGRIFLGDLVKHILEPEKVLVVGQGSHIKVYDLEQGKESLSRSRKKINAKYKK